MHFFSKKALRFITYCLILMSLAVIMCQMPVFKANASPKIPSPDVQMAAKIVAKSPAPTRFKTSGEFVQAMMPFAKTVGKKHNIDPKILIAQAAHETNWGKSIPKHKNGQSSYNLFGIKASPKSANKIQAKTTEHRKGVNRIEYASFRSYQNYGESFEHYVQLMKRDRFKAVLDLGNNPKAYFNHLQKAGYATDPKYAQKLLGVYHHPVISNSA